MNDMARRNVQGRSFWIFRLAGLILILAGGISGAGMAGEVTTGTGTADGSFPHVVGNAGDGATITFSGSGNNVVLADPEHITQDNLTISGNRSGTLFNLASIADLTAKAGDLGNNTSFYLQALNAASADLYDPTVSANYAIITIDRITNDITTLISSDITNALTTTLSTIGGATLTAIGRNAPISMSAVPPLGVQNLFRWNQTGNSTDFPDNLAITNIHFNGYDFSGETNSGITSTHSMIGPANPINDTNSVVQTIKRVEGNWFDGNGIKMTVADGNSMVPALFTLRAGNANGDNTVPGTAGMNFTIDNVIGNLFDNVKVFIRGGSLNGAGWFGTSFGVFSKKSISGEVSIDAVHNINKIAGNVFYGDGSQIIPTNYADRIQGSGIAGIRIDIDRQTLGNAGT
ncbi:MAG: hypothetical protein LBE84_05100, partial [Planctomycetota bacterium]|nr:hypothetical protein [Planctomycetota bacterium]